MKKKEFIEITCLLGSLDDKMFTKVVNRGIDSHLQAFTKSKFKFKINPPMSRLVLNFHISELPLLVRRLEEMGTESADTWAQDIKDLPEYPDNE